MDTDLTTDVKLDEKVQMDLHVPKKWHVVFLNDNQTPMEFVIGILTELYKHTTDTATKITLEIHEQGSGIAGTYSFEIAEVKAVETTNLARTNGFPLQIKLEEEQ